MQVTVTFRRIEATDSIRDYADTKVRRVVSKYFRRPLEGHIVLSVSKRRHSAEITVVADRLTLKQLREDHDLIKPLLEESLRHDPPVQMLMRLTTSDTQVAGTDIPKQRQ